MKPSLVNKLLSRNLTSFSRTLCPSPWNPFNQLPFLVSLKKRLLMKVLCCNQFPKTLKIKSNPVVFFTFESFSCLKDSKVKKTTGLDGISARFLKDGASVIAPTVTFLVNLSLFTGIVPCDWKIARIAPFISLADMKVWTTTDQSPFCRLIMSKIIEKAVNVQLQRYRQRFDLLSPFQPGLDNTIQRRVL